MKILNCIESIIKVKVKWIGYDQVLNELHFGKKAFLALKEGQSILRAFKIYSQNIQ